MSRRAAAKQRQRGQSEASSLRPDFQFKGIKQTKPPAARKPKPIDQVQNELDFSQWYSEAEEGLLEASYDGYQ